MRIQVDFLPDFEQTDEVLFLRIVSYHQKQRFKQNYVDRIIQTSPVDKDNKPVSEIAIQTIIENTPNPPSRAESRLENTNADIEIIGTKPRAVLKVEKGINPDPFTNIRN